MPRVEVDICPKCKQPRGERHVPTMKRPGLRALERYSFDGIAKATDGCKVEPDGVCQHGHSSWLLCLGYI